MINQNRRRFIKFLVVGGGVGFFAKFFGPSIFNMIGSGNLDAVQDNNISNFRIKENKNGLTIYSEGGQELFIIDNEK